VKQVQLQVTFSGPTPCIVRFELNKLILILIILF